LKHAPPLAIRLVAHTLGGALSHHPPAPASLPFTRPQCGAHQPCHTEPLGRRWWLDCKV